MTPSAGSRRQKEASSPSARRRHPMHPSFRYPEAPLPSHGEVQGKQEHPLWVDEMALVLVTLVWGSTFVVVGGLVARVPPSQVLVVRFTLAAGLLALLARRRWPRGDARLRRGGIVLGLWLAAGFGFQTLGLAYTTPARAAFITGFCVVLPPLIAAVVERRRPHARVLLAALMAGAGVGVISWPGHGEGINAGDVLVGVCALAYGAHIYATGHYARHTRADALTAVQIAVAAGIFAAGSAAATAAVRLAPAGHAPAWASALAGRPWEWSLAVVGPIVYLALFATVLAYSLQTHSQRRVSASRAGILFALEPLFAAAISVGLGVDALTWRLAAGGVLVMGGIVVSGDGAIGNT